MPILKKAQKSPIVTPVQTKVAPADAALPAATQQSLQKIAAAVASPKPAAPRGVVALFAGTDRASQAAAATVLAQHTARPLLRVDLSKVVSKYIGETEKNLSRLFDRAQAANAILFFDEADALFGKRSKVQDSHDRFASVEISFLLQRMEAFQGLAILATNDVKRIDPAVKKLCSYVVKFPPKA